MSPARYQKFLERMEQRSAPILEMHFEGEDLVSIEATHEGKKVQASTIADFNEILDELRAEGVDPEALDTFNRDRP
jgi:hypothetical protein